MSILAIAYNNVFHHVSMNDDNDEIVQMVFLVRCYASYDFSLFDGANVNVSFDTNYSCLIQYVRNHCQRHKQFCCNFYFSSFYVLLFLFSLHSVKFDHVKIFVICFILISQCYIIRTLALEQEDNGSWTFRPRSEAIGDGFESSFFVVL